MVRMLLTLNLEQEVTEAAELIDGRSHAKVLRRKGIVGRQRVLNVQSMKATFPPVFLGDFAPLRETQSSLAMCYNANGRASQRAKRALRGGFGLVSSEFGDLGSPAPFLFWSVSNCQ